MPDPQGEILQVVPQHELIEAVRVLGCMVEAASAQGRKLEIVDIAAWSATSQLRDAVRVRKVKITPACLDGLEGGQGSKGNALTLSSQIPWRRPCQHSWSSQLQATLFPSPQATVGQAGKHSLQPSSPLCNVWLWQAPGLQDGKGGLVQARGSQLQRAALARRQAVVSTLVCQKGTGSQHPQEPRGSQNAFTPAASTPRHGGLSWDGPVQSLGEVPSP